MSFNNHIADVKKHAQPPAWNARRLNLARIMLNSILSRASVSVRLGGLDKFVLIGKVLISVY